MTLVSNTNQTFSFEFNDFVSFGHFNKHECSFFLHVLMHSPLENAKTLLAAHGRWRVGQHPQHGAPEERVLRLIDDSEHVEERDAFFVVVVFVFWFFF